MAKKDLANDYLVEAVKEMQGEKALPPMTPDTFDDFVTFLHKRVDLRSFDRSKIEYKIKLFRDFIHSLPNKEIKKLIFSKDKKNQ